MALFHKFFDQLGAEMKRYGNFVNHKEIGEIDVTVKEIILTTVEHAIPDTPNCSKYDHRVDNATDLMRVFLDMVQSVKAADPDDYTDYCYRIRQEYKHISDKQYLEDRIKFLKQLGGMSDEQDYDDPKDASPMFFSYWGQKRFQKKAVTNINNEIEWLRQV